jgi:hypothetical protein
VATHTGKDPISMAHVQAHMVRMQELAGDQKTTGQGVRQQAAAPSAAEIGQGGVTRGIDFQGTATKEAGRGSQTNAG